MKRLMMEKGEHVVLSGLREMHFGELFQGRAADAEVNEGIMPEGYNHLVYGATIIHFIVSSASMCIYN